MAVPRDESHEIISSYFIGPGSENLPAFRANISVILEELQKTREKYQEKHANGNGYKFITAAIQDSDAFKNAVSKVAEAVKTMAEMLGTYSIPFWSPRYQAHMCSDLSMPALLGYFMTMLYNPNNVALEVSPLTTVAEVMVGEQICDLFGFNSPGRKGWGHITGGGTVANLESIWAARNLKFYPLAVHSAIKEPNGPLAFIGETFFIETCKGPKKTFKDLTTWELLNLRPSTILGIPEQLRQLAGINPDWLQKVLIPYSVQTRGRDKIRDKYQFERMRYFIPSTQHYSWPKGMAVTDMGEEHTAVVDVDETARMSIAELRRLLDESLSKRKAVFAVVAVIGSTEEGAVDPLYEILQLRELFQQKGLSFMVHADAAWGGYFATMLTSGRNDRISRAPTIGTEIDGLVPDLSLRFETQRDLLALRHCDSVTVDPHKSGYIPYPAGVLAYSDQRMKNLVQWTGPYLSRGQISIGNGGYGLEGSKPGAAAVATWLSNHCIGLNQRGYGALLAEACFTSARFAALWAALSEETDSFVCVPFNMLPSEAERGGDEQTRREKIRSEKTRIRNTILTRTNEQILAAVGDSTNTLSLLRALGSDLNINAFALNWKVDGTQLNTDVEEANLLMSRVIRRLSVESPDALPQDIALYLTSTEFSHEQYGECLRAFKQRLGLNVDSEQGLMVLRNVVMSPLASFTGGQNFIQDIGEVFKKVVKEEVEICRARNADDGDRHKFWVHGNHRIFLSYQPTFHLKRRCRQVILEVTFNSGGMRKYRELRENLDATKPLVIHTAERTRLSGILTRGAQFNAKLIHGSVDQGPVQVTVTKIIKNRPLGRSARDDAYPADFMPFYLYGTPQERHIDHILVRSPNISLTAGNVRLHIDNIDRNGGSAGLVESEGAVVSLEEEIGKGAIVTFDSLHEASMQPFEKAEGAGFFRSGAWFPIRVWRDTNGPSDGVRGMLAAVLKETQPLATGMLRLDVDVVVDLGVNDDELNDSLRVDAAVGLENMKAKFSTVAKIQSD